LNLPTDVPLTGEQARLALALNDMQQAAAAARLLDQQRDHHARRALETAISVCYARPWLPSNRSGKLKDTWRPVAGSDRDLHSRLLQLRRQTYAHTSPEGGRKPQVQVVSVGHKKTLAIGEQWIPLPVADLLPIADLCDRQAARFMQALIDALDAAGF
jgi:hypothetical protein